jgi:hypothetical protein
MTIWGMRPLVVKAEEEGAGGERERERIIRTRGEV